MKVRWHAEELRRRSRTPRRIQAASSRTGSIVWTVVVVMFVAAVIVGTIWYFMRDSSTADPNAPITETVATGPFDHIVLEQGEVESSSNVEVICEIKSRSMGSGGVAILWVIDEGSRVKKGDKLVELDSSALDQELKQQRNVVSSSHASKISAEALLQQAIYARQEYLDGTFTTEERAILSEIAVAEQELRKAQLKLQSGERLTAKGLVGPLQLEADQFAVQNAKNVLESAQGRLRVLRELTKQKMLVQYDSDIETAKANVGSQTKIYEEEVAKMEDLEDQIKKCIILAPEDGIVVHANQYSSRGGNAEFVVEAGAIVRERQTIARLPDPAKMQVRAKINESQVSLVKEGMPVRIKIGASAGQELEGTVTKVNKYAEPSSWFSSQVKEFATFVAINDPPPTIRTGMTAEVKILVDHHDNAVQVPVQAIHEYRGHTFSLVETAKDKFETREVMIDASNDKVVAIDQGLAVGETVVLNPRQHLDLFNFPDLPETQAPNSDAFKQYQQTAGSSSAPAAGGAGPPGANGTAGGPSGRPGGSGGGPGGPGGFPGGRPTPEALVARTFENYDTDSDGKLSTDELQQMPEQFRGGAQSADANSDGFVDRAEMTTSIRARFAAGGPGGGGPGGGGAPAGGGQ